MKNMIKSKIENEITHYKGDTDKSNHAGFCIDAHYFEMDNNGIRADFSELLVIVEKSWLFKQMRSQRISNPQEYLLNSYTLSDAVKWYKTACKAHKIVYVRYL